MSENNENFVVKEDIYVLAEEPLPGATPEMVREWYAENNGEQALAIAFAETFNKAWDLGMDIDFIERNTPEFEEALAITNAWFSLSDELEGKILDVLRTEGSIIPEEQIWDVLCLFMERNGYFYGNGWWFEINEEE